MPRKRMSRWIKNVPRSRRRPRRPPLSSQHRQPLPYERREGLLSRGELAFFRVLCQAIPTEYAISIKTRLADVVRCPPQLWDSPHGRRLSQKHVDFVVYNRCTAAIVAVVELDDRTHEATDRRDRDAFVDAVLDCAGLRILRVRAAYRYDAHALRLQLDLRPTAPANSLFKKRGAA
jgi:hypothetical protein